MLYYLDQPVPPSIQAYLQSFASPHLKYVNEKTHEDINETLHVSKSSSLPRQRSKTFNKNDYEAYRPQSATLFRETKKKARAKLDDKQPQRQQKSNKNHFKSKSLTDLSESRRSRIPRKVDKSTPKKQENHRNRLNKTFPFFKTVHDENDNLIGKERYEIPMKSLSKGSNVRHKRYDSVSSNTSFESTSTNISMADIDYSDNSFNEALPPYGKRPASAPGFLRKSSISRIPRARRSFKNLPFSNFSHLNKYKEEKQASPRCSRPSSPENRKKLPDLRDVIEQQPKITSFNNLPRSKSEVDLALLRTKSNEKRTSSNSRSRVVFASDSIDRLNVMYANEHAYFHHSSTIKRSENDDNDSTYSSLICSLESQSPSLSEDISKVFYLARITI